MAPTPKQFEVALKALQTDSELWAKVSADLAFAKQRASALDLRPLQVTYIADKLGFLEAYQKLQDKVIRLLGEGEQNATEVTGALLAVKATYEREEQEGVHRMKGIW
jgi:hypothetical protein